MAAIEFVIPCFALAHREADDPMAMAQAVVDSDFGNMGRCVMLFRDRKTVEGTGKKLGHDIVVEVGNAAFLMLVADAAISRGCLRAAVDYMRTPDGQACHFHELSEIMAFARSLHGRMG